LRGKDITSSGATTGQLNKT